MFTLNHDSLWLVEIHKEEPTEVEDIFEKNGYSCTYNPPTITDKNGTHGGELVAFKSNYYYKSISQTTLDLLSTQLGPLRFAAKILVLHKVLPVAQRRL